MIYTVLATISFLIFLLSNRRYRWIYIIYKTYRRDLTAFKRFVHLNIRMWYLQKTNTTVVKAFKKCAEKHPDKIAIHFEDSSWTFKQLDDFSDKIGTYFKNAGYQQNDTVALLLMGRPEYVGIWLGLAKIGVVTALVNTNLSNEPLLHSLRAAKAKSLIYGSEFKTVINNVVDNIQNLPLYELSETDNNTEVDSSRINLRNELKKVQNESLSKYYSKINAKDKLMYIYTSGTTGLPKAAVITNSRYIFMTNACNVMTAMDDSDVLYDPLPLYHTAGGIVGLGQCVVNGLTVAIRKKFSASNFWPDCTKYKCTCAQYIGELCRYLLAVPEKPNENTTVTMMVGNGLKAQIWEKFVKRFNIQQVYELYGSTEGNSNLINLDSKVGAVGFTPRYACGLHPVTLVRCDDNGVPIRNAKGHCIECQIEEPGVFVGKIVHKKVFNEFVGYADDDATSKKILKNVFKQGDRYFNSGDVLVQDELGYFYFKDRTGDTFRWKGENVATSEVEAVISNIVNLNDAVVYGVEIPNTDGRAGMAAIVDESNTLDLNKFGKEVVKSLPAYALPLFLRIMKEVPLTGTFKLKKVDLQKDGFNVNKIQDKLYVYDFKAKQYMLLTKDIYEDILSGKVRL